MDKSETEEDLSLGERPVVLVRVFRELGIDKMENRRGLKLSTTEMKEK